MTILNFTTTYCENEDGDDTFLRELQMTVRIEDNESEDDLYKMALKALQRATGVYPDNDRYTTAAPAPTPEFPVGKGTQPDTAYYGAPAIKRADDDPDYDPEAEWAKYRPVPCGSAPTQAPETGQNVDPADRFASFGTKKVRNQNAITLYHALVEAAQEGYTVPEAQIERLPKKDQPTLREALKAPAAQDDEAKAQRTGERAMRENGSHNDPAPAEDRLPDDQVADFRDGLGDFFDEPTEAPTEAPADTTAQDDAELDALMFGGDAPEPVFEDWSDQDVQDVLRAEAGRLGGAGQILPVLNQYKQPGGGASTVKKEDRPKFVAEVKALQTQG